jgi:hypothetical protein
MDAASGLIPAPRMVRSYEAGFRVQATVATESGPAALMLYEPEPATILRIRSRM